MRERPILFSGAMVRAILDGQKAQTRRVVKITLRTPGLAACLEARGFEPRTTTAAELCPYGQPGDRLWVRECFSHREEICADEPETPVWFWADGNPEYGNWTRPKPSIHLPRWACRLVLEVTEVRVQRLQEISEPDSRAEGITDGGCMTCGNSEPCGCANPDPSARESFIWLWNSINEKRGFGWLRDPWVWAITFRRVA